MAAAHPRREESEKNLVIVEMGKWVIGVSVYPLTKLPNYPMVWIGNEGNTSPVNRSSLEVKGEKIGTI
jgi:hypothetical protein